MAQRKRYQLTKRIDIMRQSQPTSDYLVTGDRPEFVLTAFAEVKAVQSNETEQSQQMSGITMYRVVLRRQQTPVHLTDWIEVGGRRLDITGINPDIDNDGMYMQLNCRTQQTSATHETMR
jgi:head-tail adaptor